MGRRLFVSGNELLRLRETRGLSQEQAAVQAGLTAARLRQLEKSGGSVRTETLGRLANLYGVPPDALLVWEGNDDEGGGTSRWPTSYGFDVPEYAHAESRFVYDALDALARAKDPIYRDIPRETQPRVGTTLNTIGDQVIVQEPISTETLLSVPTDDVIHTRLDAFLASLDQGASELLTTVMSGFYDYLSRVTEATGNVVDGKGKSLFDAFYEMFEKVAIDFNEDGTVAGDFRIVVSPDVAERLAREQDTWTEEQFAALERLMEKKREEYLDRRRTRRLS